MSCVRKIARLPERLHEQINRRLHDGEEGIIREEKNPTQSHHFAPNPTLSHHFETFFYPK
jgi:hypothetical protein